MGGVVARVARFRSAENASDARAFAVPSDNCASCHRIRQRRRGAHCRERVRLGKRQMQGVRIQRCDMGKASNKTHWRCRFRIRSRCGTTTLSRRHVATLRECAMHSGRAEKPVPQAASSAGIGRATAGDTGSIGRGWQHRSRPSRPMALDHPASLPPHSVGRKTAKAEMLQSSEVKRRAPAAERRRQAVAGYDMPSKNSSIAITSASSRPFAAG
jgi:hypothetical protein